MSIDRIALGTAQFGIDYGINNKRGRIPPREALVILANAFNSGIDMFDTASSYGEAEKILGIFNKRSSKEIKIISKLPECVIDKVTGIVEASLKKINSKQLYGYIIHSFKSYAETPAVFDVLKTIKSTGRIKKIGFSLYYPKELDYLLEKKIEFDLVQVPFSIFDQRFSSYFSELKRLGVEIHVRSVFLQGLVFKKKFEANDNFTKIKDKLNRLSTLSDENKIPIVALCLNFALLNKLIDKVIVGVDSLCNLKEIVQALHYQPEVKKLMSILFGLREDDEEIIVPIRWGATKAVI